MRRGNGTLESLWIDVNGLPIHTRVAVDPVPEDAPVVVLVHGLGVSTRYLVPTARKLAPDYHVLAPDLPGFGLSGKPSRTLDVPELADALAAWMNAIGLPRAAFLANSFGCQVLADFALRYPELASRIVLQGPTMDRRARHAWGQALGWFQNSPLEPLSLMPIVLRDYLDCGITRGLETFRYALHDRVEEKLPHIDVPAMVVRGGRDPIGPQRWAEEVARLLPRGRLRVIPGGSHTLVYTFPLELVRVVRPFLDEDRPWRHDHPMRRRRPREHERIRRDEAFAP